jgi:hypothetical protein
VAIYPSLYSSKKDKKEIKPLGPLRGTLMKSFNEAVDLFTSEKLEKSSGGILILYLLTFIVSFRKFWLFK